ncbi:MAG: beta-Ala-His dipeptidase [Candidatus Aenigmatarchaeota archaeon]
MTSRKTVLLVCLGLCLVLLPSIGSASEYGEINPVDVYKHHRAFNLFEEISAIPHCPGHEQALADWICSIADEHGWETQQDTIGNLLVHVPATRGFKNAPVVALQAHLDMVCLDDAGKEFDSTGFPLKLVLDNEWLSAEGTTIGADNGIGIAIALTIAIPVEYELIEHGPLELLFTVQEENGLIGAFNLDLKLLAEYMINLDGEMIGVIYTGSAGGFGSTITLPLPPLAKQNDMWEWKLNISGLTGGHSGVDIVHGRGNAAVIMARVLKEYSSQFPITLLSMEAGERSNAIPVTATAIFATPAEVRDIEDTFWRILKDFVAEFVPTTDPNFKMELTRLNPQSSISYHGATQNMIDMILSLPNGVISMSHLEGIPQTSSNMCVKIDSDTLTVSMLTRSFSMSDLDSLKEVITDISQRFGAEASLGSPFPNWEPVDSPLLEIAGKTWNDLHNDYLTPRDSVTITAVHAGVECGVISGEYPGMNIIATGPTIENLHTANERLLVSSVADIYLFLYCLLPALAK